MSDDVPLLDDLMPWSAAPLRLGRDWVMAPDAGSLRARWTSLVRSEDEKERGALFRVTRSRTLHSAVAQLPGHAAPTGRLIREHGPCPEPVRVLHGAFDQQWLIPDHRLIDSARPEVWRVADARQVFVVEQGDVPQDRQPPGGERASGGERVSRGEGVSGPALVLSALLPDGHAPAGRPGRIRPLYRRPGGGEPNLAPGLLPLLAERFACTVTAEDVLAWIAAAARRSPAGCVVPLTGSAEVWEAGVGLGRRMRWIQLRGDRSGERPRLPGGRRPYVRAPIPARPDDLHYDADEHALRVGEGRIAPVPPEAWEFHAGGGRVLQGWLEARTPGAAQPDALAAIGPRAWPQEWTSELLELITVLALLAGLGPEQRELAARIDTGRRIDAAALRRVGVLPVPDAVRRPASVLDHHEEGPEGQFALL